MDTEKQKTFIVRFLYFAIILGIAIAACRFVLPALLPFFIAVLVALLLKPVIRFLHEKCHVHKGVAGVVLSLLFYALIGFLLTILFIRLFATAKVFFTSLPTVYTSTVQPWLTAVFDSLQGFTSRLDPQAAAAYDVVAEKLIQTLGDSVSTLSKSVVSGVTSLTFRTPGILLDILIAIIATVFIAADWSKLSQFVMRQFAPKTRVLVESIRTHLGLTLGRYVRSYALIMLITFAELSVGLSIIGIQSPFGIAALISVFDILPVLGSGTVLIPWAIISTIQGDYLRALGLAIVYLVVVVIRNIIEPKIIGNHVGLHPIVTLLAMVAGVYIFGPIGLLGLPVTLALIHSLNDEGVIHLYDNAEQNAGERPGDSGDTPNGGGGLDGPLTPAQSADKQKQKRASLFTRRKTPPSGTDMGA